MNSSFTDSNYTQLTEVYSRYKDKGLGFCALLSIFSIPVSVCVYLCTYVYENELCDPPVIDLVGISYLYDELNLKKKKKKKICFVTFVLCRIPMLDFSGYYYYLRSYEIVPIKMLLMFLLFFWSLLRGNYSVMTIS